MVYIVESACSDGDTRLSNGGEGYLNTGRSFSIGRPEICTDGDYIPVCGYIDDVEAITFCASTSDRYGMFMHDIVYTCYIKGWCIESEKHTISIPTAEIL